MKKWIKISLCFMTLVLYGCESSSNIESDDGGASSMPTTTTDVEKVNSPVVTTKPVSLETEISNQSNLIKKDPNKKTFSLVYDNEKLILTSAKDLDLIEKNSEMYLYKKGALQAVSQGGKGTNFGLISTAEIATKNGSIFDNASKLYQRISFQKRPDIKTGSILNYSCVNKVRQIAQTKRIFTPSVVAKEPNRLVGIIRLNGNKFYDLDCVIQGDTVTSLSLITKK